MAPSFMFIAGDASGDMLGAELLTALRARLGGEGRFFGAGGPAMTAAGLELVEDFTREGVFGIEALGKVFEFRQRFRRLLALAIERRPDVLVCVDFAGFNRRFAHAVQEHARQNPAAGWRPRVVQYVSPQVWASRPGRARKMAGDVDLLLTIFPFEKAWYAQRVPELRVEFVGHPIVDRHGPPPEPRPPNFEAPTVLLLPGSRPGELRRHLPVLAGTMRRLRGSVPGAQAVMVLPERWQGLAAEIGLPEGVRVEPSLATALRQADVAIAKSGTVTLECAFLGVPSVVFYRAGALTTLAAKVLMTVRWVAMPNILANEEVFPEFLGRAATEETLTRSVLELMRDGPRRTRVQEKLRQLAASLGEPGASGRAAGFIIQLLEKK